MLEQALQNPVYAELPPGGVPGVKPGSLVQILGNVYGANDAPANWHHEFDKVATSVGFTKSKFDSCLYLCFDSKGRLQGVLGAHAEGNFWELNTVKTRKPWRSHINSKTMPKASDPLASLRKGLVSIGSQQVRKRWQPLELSMAL